MCPWESSDSGNLAASITDSARNRSDSMEDVDNQQDRKRIRLDVGNLFVADEALSGADGLQSIPAAPSAETSPQAPHGSPPPSLSTTRAANISPTTAAILSSKVTINTRPSSAKSVMASGPANDNDEGATPELVPDAETSPSHPHPDPVSINSSPTGSPEIEIAEPEDIDQDPGLTRWTPITRLSSTSNSPALALSSSYVFDTFPRAGEGGMNFTEAVIANYAKQFRFGVENHEQDPFLDIARWMKQFLDDCKELTAEFIAYDLNFWTELPTLIHSLLRRKVSLPPQTTVEVVQELLLQFSRIALLFIDFDIAAIRKLPDGANQSALVSLPFLQALEAVLHPRTVPFYNVLVLKHGYDQNEIKWDIARSIVTTPYDAVEKLDTLAIMISENLQKRPKLAIPYMEILRVVSDIAINLFTESTPPSDGGQKQVGRITNQCFRFMRNFDQVYQQSISKQWPWLTIDSSIEVFQFLLLSYKCLIMTDRTFVEQLLGDDHESPELLRPLEAAEIALCDWKSATFWSAITAGRMELRAQGMEQMQTELIDVFKNFIRGNERAADHLVVRRLVKFLRNKRIVDYLVGPESHPQLLHRSGNVIGFLAVSKAYTKQDTDLIWDCILENRDSRMVGEMWLVMHTLMDLLDGANVEYLFSKLFEFPLSRFDGRTLDYCAALLRVIDMRHQDCVTNMYRVNFFVHLLRAESGATELPLEFRSSLRKFASEGLSQLSYSTVDDPDVSQIWQVCVDDISNRSPSSTGSIRVIQALMNNDPMAVLNHLSRIYDLPNLVIQELADQVEHSPENFRDETFLDHHFTTRVLMLASIFTYAPTTIDNILAESLWKNVFNSPVIDPRARDYAWNTLSNIAQTCQSKNAFLDLWTHSYVCRLTPDQYSISSLRYLEAIVAYEIHNDIVRASPAHNLLDAPGINRIWRVILTSPPGTVELPAIKFLIQFYLESVTVLQSARAIVESIHIALVDRCIRQIDEAAASLKAFSDGTISGDDEPMVLIASDAEIHEQELRFTRSLSFLRQFLSALKKSPRYSPPPTDKIEDQALLDIRGEEATIKYQAFTNGKGTPVVSALQAGDLNTANELAMTLRSRTGISMFNGIHGGRIIELFGNHETLKELKIGVSGLLMIRQTLESSDKESGGRRNSLTHVDSEIERHFDRLYDLLDLDGHLAAEIFNFLQVFPVQSRIQILVRQPDVLAKTALPLDKPYKLLYSANALYLALEDESFKSEPDQIFVQHSVRMLLAVYADFAPLYQDDLTQWTILASLTDCMLMALRVRVLPETSSQYIPDPKILLEHILRAIDVSTQQPELNLHGPASRPLVGQAFAVLIEASMHNSQVWDQVETFKDPAAMIEQVLLGEQVSDARKLIVDVVSSLTGPPSNKNYVKTQAISSLRIRFTGGKIQHLLERLWMAMYPALPKTLRVPTVSRELYEVSHAVFREIGRDQKIENLIPLWGRMLAEYEPQQVVGRQSDDYVVSGLARLLILALDFLQSSERFVKSPNLLDTILTKYLCPELSSNTEGSVLEPKVPILNSTVRQDLYMLVLQLCVDQDDFDSVLDSVEDMNNGYTYEPQYQNDRIALRSEAGHSGLRNLSNTCYLNSLFTQLYMNLEFRRFILTVDSQATLIVELRKLFAFMQSSWHRALDPSKVVDSIQTYDNESIDVAVQMDVDEFYNLLFDRLESGMPSTEIKSKFRSMYGGQLVQQIKSKECEHISERLEPFSAIQCEIRSRNDLEESLRAYVEGEVMQGDNKYSCSACGRHVDAVKRACLKDLPNHLIFHLKRFDFDINTMTRCKINDEFAFPEMIDMAPYKVENLTDSSKDAVPDVFELVGVLVHSGTAESGHYYSFIRERPSITDFKNSWTQFNDSDVSSFNYERIGDCCFGGVDSPAMRTSKVWSAYMLFYQRTTSVESFISEFPQTGAGGPVSLDLSPDLGSHIALENELYARNYCAQDSSHAHFIYSLLAKMKVGIEKKCSDSHVIESKTLRLALAYVDHVSSRFKDLPDVDSSFKVLQKYAGSCPLCAEAILMWFRLNRDSFRASILRNPQSMVRSSFSTLISGSLRSLHDFATSRLSPQAELGIRRKQYRRLLDDTMEMIDHEWKSIYNFPRAWDDYFNLLHRIASLGFAETGIVVENGYLERCLEMIWIEVEEDPKHLREKYSNHWRWREKGRVYLYQGLLNLLAGLLEYIDANVIRLERAEHDRYYSISPYEQNLLGPTRVERGMALRWLQQAIESQWNTNACARIIETLSDSRFSTAVVGCIREGLQSEPAAAAQPFLQAALEFTRTSPERKAVHTLVLYALESVSTIGDSGGREHLGFVQHLLEAENQSLELKPSDFQDIAFSYVGKWAPALLTFPESAVRSGTVDLLHDRLLCWLDDENEDPAAVRSREKARSRAYALGVSLYQKLEEMKGDQHARGGGHTLSKAIMKQNLDVLQIITRDVEGDDSELWQGVLSESNPRKCGESGKLTLCEGITNWMRQSVDREASNLSDESEANSWANQASDSDDPEFTWTENVSAEDFSPGP